MLLKILGICMILGAGGMAACSAVGTERRKLSVLDGWIDLILHIRGQIDCYLTPLEDILIHADPKLLSACMGTSKDRTPAELLRRSAPFLDPESNRLLEGFTREIGSSYREEQIKRCDHYLLVLQKNREQLASQLPARIKVSATLCICGALGTAILLW